MAPHGEAVVVVGSPFITPVNVNNFSKSNPRRLSNDGLKRTTSDISYLQLLISKEANNNNHIDHHDCTEDHVSSLPAIPEVLVVLEDAKCECCGMMEEYTVEYVGKVREKFGGKWICGLCAEAVKEETEKNGGRREEALEAHMNACFRFNKFGRAFPVLSQAQAMREMFRKSVSLDGRRRPKSGVLMIKNKAGQIARSSSCNIPALTREINDFKLGSNVV